MHVEQLLSKFERVKKIASGWLVCCPAHKDASPSLNISTNSTRILLHCHAGCNNEAIVQALGLEMKDLFYDEPLTRTGTGRVETEYQYQDESGNHIFSVHRIDEPGKEKRIWQKPAPGKTLADVKHYLYHLPEVLEAVKAGTIIIIAEGEKCVDACRARLDAVATTNSQGAGKWTSGHAAFLKGAKVVILPDNDEPGRRHALQVARSLQGVAESVKIVPLPGLSEKGDVVDWLDRGATREALERLIVEASLFDPAAVEAEAAKQWESLVFVPTLDNCPPDSKTLIELSGHRILSRGNLALLSALAGSGKSAILEAACASLFNSMGDNLGVSVLAGSVFYVDTERSRHDFYVSWQRFLKRAGLTESPAAVQWQNIRAIDGVTVRLEYLWSRIDREGAPELVFIDGIGDFVNNVNDPDEVSPLVNRLLSVTDRRNIGILATLHVNPGQASEKARGVLGSELWRKAESVLIIEKTPGDDTRRLTTDYNLGKNRSGDDRISSYFRWNNDQKMHVSTGKPAEAKGKTVSGREKIMELVRTKPLWSYNELKIGIMDLLGCSQGTAKSKIKDLVTLEKIKKNDDGLYSAVIGDGIMQPEWIQK